MITTKNNILQIVASICLLVLQAFCFYGHYDSDDFYFKDVLSQQSILEFQYLSYMRWDGRALTVSVLLNLGLIKYASPQVIVLIWELFFMLSVAYALKLAVKGFKLFSKQSFLLYSVFCFVFWLGNYTNIADTVYWCTAGSYTVNVFLLLLWIDLFKKVLNLPKWKFSLFILFTFIVASLATQVAVVLVTAIALRFLQKKLVRNRTQLLLILLFTVCGLLFTMLAPGNFNRATFSPRGFDLQPFAILQNTTMVYLRYTAYGALLFFLSALAGLTLFKVDKTTFWKENIFTRKKWNVETLQYVILAVVSVLPLVIIPDFAGHRPSIFFLWLGAVQIIHLCEGLFHNPVNYKNLFAWFSVFLIILSIQHYSSYGFHSKFLSREAYLHKHRNDDLVEIAPINAKIIPFTYKYNDVINQPFAKHYGVKNLKYNQEDVPAPVYLRTFLNNLILEKSSQ